MMEWFVNLKENFTISDVMAVVVPIIGGLAAIIGWIKSAANAKRAKKETELAAQYAKNADEANQSAKRYYDEMHEHLEKQSERLDRETLKKKVLLVLDDGMIYTLEQVSAKTGIIVEEVDNLLKEISVSGQRFHRYHTTNVLKDQSVQIKR